VNLIYIDPPFDTGADFSFTAAIPSSSSGDADDSSPFVKEPSILEQKAYRDTWGKGLNSYLDWLYQTAVLLRELLAESGSLYVHLDWHVVHYAKVVLDELFGQEQAQNQIIWKRTFAHGYSDRYGPVHDTILFYSKTPSPVWTDLRTAHDAAYIKEHFKQVDAKSGRRFQAISLTGAGIRRGESGKPWRKIDPTRVGRHWALPGQVLDRLGLSGRTVQESLDALDRADMIYWPQKEDGTPRLKYFEDELEGVALPDLWIDIPPISAQAAERIGYPTQKPEALLDRIIRASSKEGALVLDCFVGSGTTAAVAEKLNRRWIACDLSRFAIHTTRKRLLGIPNVRPFAVQNLGKYERQAWQVAEFPANGKDRLEEQCQREAAYRSFILDLYHSKPITGYVWLHGTKGGRMVHVAAVDAPVTQADVKAIAREAWKAIGASKDAPTKAAVDILGWEFALEVNELAKQVAAESRVDVSFKKIPREVLDKKAVEQGDVKFFELGALTVDMKQKSRAVTLKLSDFVIPTDDIPEEARKAIKHWSQLVDYWAVDWDFKNDTFHNQWQAYRTRKDPKIELATNYEYKETGKYQIVVKVIDILGNDTTKTLEISVA
jgi:adenine-specific DNA-methyltransferase